MNMATKRESMVRQILQNMVESGDLLPDDAQTKYQELYQLNPKDLLAVLTESQMALEACGDVVRHWYPIGIICLN